jgi:hypothetical protein
VAHGRNHWRYVKCGVHTGKINEYYVLHDELWQRVVDRWKIPPDKRGESGMICIGCFESLLGRKLTKHDFKDCPVNDLTRYWGFDKSDRLRDRLTAGGAYRWQHAKARARCFARPPRLRRDRASHQLHGADRGLGHARSRLLHPGQADQADGLYRQMVGRVLRPADGKTDAIVIDHSGNVFRHGFAEDPVKWTLDPDSYAENPVHAKRDEPGSTSRVLECSQCGIWGRVAGEPCPHCGFLPQVPPKSIVVAEGDLGLVQGGRAKANEYDPITRLKWFAIFVAYAAEHPHYKLGWSAVQYKEKFGVWPPDYMTPASVEPISPTPECRSWIRSRMIAFAKARQRAAP